MIHRTRLWVDGIEHLIVPATIAIRWRANPERDAWYLEDRDGRSQNAGWTAATGSAIFVLGLSGMRAADDTERIVEILRGSHDRRSCGSRFRGACVPVTAPGGATLLNRLAKGQGGN